MKFFKQNINKQFSIQVIFNLCLKFEFYVRSILEIQVLNYDITQSLPAKMFEK